MEVERLQQRVEALDVAVEPVGLLARRLVRAAKAEMVGDDRAVAVRNERPDEIAVEEAPGRVAVEEHDGAAIAGALVHVVHPPFRCVEPLRLIWPQPTERPVDPHERQP